MSGKVLIDVSNRLNFSQGMPPALLAKYDGLTSLGEEIQKASPDAKVVKAFNTVSAMAMVNAGFVPGDHDLFIAGNGADAKKAVEALARSEFGWKSFVDLGDIVGARALEHLLPLWLQLWMIGGTPAVNLKLVRQETCNGGSGDQREDRKRDFRPLEHRRSRYARWICRRVDVARPRTPTRISALLQSRGRAFWMSCRCSAHACRMHALILPDRPPRTMILR